MRSRSLAVAGRHVARLALLCVLFPTWSLAQTVPSPAPAPGEPAIAAPVAPEAAPAPVAEPAPVPGTAPTAAAPVAPATPLPRAKVLLLPVEFDVYEQGAGGTRELVKDWTDAARANLASAATDVLGERTGLELVPMPELTPQEQQVLRDHVGVAKLIASQGTQLAGKPWERRRADFDRQLGDGLAFLHEKTTADYVLLIDGAQAKQTGGSIFTQALLLATLGVGMPGGGTFIRATLIDLEAGQVKWFNQSIGLQVFGFTGSDASQSDDTKNMLRGLFKPYPAIPALL